MRPALRVRGSYTERVPPLFGKSLDALTELVEALGEPAFRARQLAQALYRDRVASLAAVTTLPLTLRERLAERGWVTGMPELAQTFRSVDGTERYLVRLQDGLTVETVWMPNGDGGEAGDGSEASREELREGFGRDPGRNGEGSSGRQRVASTVCVSSTLR